MQRLIFALLCIAAQHTPHVDALALRSTSVAVGSVASGTTESCQYECGIESITAHWEEVGDSGEATRKMSEVFTVGVGGGVKYKRSPKQCLSRCQVLSVSKRCAKLTGGTRSYTKVAKTGDKKLCCVPRTCNYDPEEERYTPHEEGDQFKKLFGEYKDLKEIKGDSVPARTCLCCDKESDEIAWDARVRHHCKEAYSSSMTGNFWKEVARIGTLGGTEEGLKMMCGSYCSHYSGHSFGKMSKESRSITASALNPTAGEADE